MSKFPKDEYIMTGGVEDRLTRRGFLRLAGVSALGVAASSVIAKSAVAAVSGPAKAGGYPTRPINLICPYGAGGGSDQLDRTLSAYAKKVLGVPMPVQNVPGGSGAIGLAKLAGSSPDGYTIASIIADNICSLAFSKQPWNLDQVTGICRLMNVPSFYFSNAKKGKFKTIQEVIAAAKAKPGAIRVGTDGRNSVDQLTSLIVGMKAGVKFRLVPFSKPSDRYTSLLNGEVDILYEQAGDVARYIQSGQFHPLVIFSKTKLDQLPKVPTSESLGWPVYFSQYRGIVAPAGTPSAIQKTLFGAFQTWGKSDAFKKFVKQQYMTPDSFQGPEFFRNEIQENLKQFKKAIKDTGLA